MMYLFNQLEECTISFKTNDYSKSNLQIKIKSIHKFVNKMTNENRLKIRSNVYDG